MGDVVDFKGRRAPMTPQRRNNRRVLRRQAMREFTGSVSETPPSEKDYGPDIDTAKMTPQERALYGFDPYDGMGLTLDSEDAQ